MEKTNIIPIDDKLNLFAEYLANNDRAILSARFGDGKTFFLDEFKNRYSSDYIFLTLYPVLYQVADNKDTDNSCSEQNDCLECHMQQISY